MQQIEKTINKISQEALYTVIPDAAKKIYTPYTSARDIVTKEKIKKDVVNKEEEESQFKQYEKATDILANVLDLIRNNMSALVVYDSEVKTKLKKGKNYTAMVAVIVAIVSVIITVFITWAWL